MRTILEAQKLVDGQWISDPDVLANGVENPVSVGAASVRWLYQERGGYTGYGTHPPINPPSGPPLRVLVAEQDFEG